MKILHIINYYQEGFGYQENLLAFYQKKLGHDVVIVTSDWYFPFPYYESTVFKTLKERFVGVGWYQDNGINIYRKKSFFQKIGPPGFIWFTALNEIRRFKPNIIHVHGATSLTIFELLLFKKKYSYKIFIDSHQDYSVNNRSNSILYKSYYFLWRFLYNNLKQKKKINKFLPITNSAKKWLKEKLNLNDQEMMIVPLGVDTKLMKYDPNLENSFRKYYKINNKIILINAGKQYEKKRIDWVVDVAIAALKKKLNIFLILVGDTTNDYNQILSEKLKILGENNFIRLPFLKREDLRKVYCASDIGIWPGIPSITILEAMACRVAMILPDDDIVGHLVHNNGIKESININNAVEFIHQVSKDKKKLFECKINSEKKIHQFDWESITVNLLDMYNKY